MVNRNLKFLVLLFFVMGILSVPSNAQGITCAWGNETYNPNPLSAKFVIGSKLKVDYDIDCPMHALCFYDESNVLKSSKMMPDACPMGGSIAWVDTTSGTDSLGTWTFTSNFNSNVCDLTPASGCILTMEVVECLADGDCGAGTCDLVNNICLPTCTLTAPPQEAVRGSTITLKSSTYSSSSATVNPGLVAITIGTNINTNVVFDPGASDFITYTMDLVGPGGTVPNACSTTVDLLPRCTIIADKTEMAPGDNLTLTYSTWDSVSGSIDAAPNFIPFPVAATIAGIPTDLFNGNSFPGTYTLTVTAVNTKTNTCQVVVDSLTNCDLTLSKTTLVEGDSAVLTWTTNGATTGTIVDTYTGLTKATAPPLNGTVTVFPTTTSLTTPTTTTYKMDVSGAGTGFCTVSIEVKPEVIPVCDSFTATLTTLKVGQGTKLMWTSHDAIRAEIDNGVGNVAPVDAGEKFFFPTVVGSYPIKLKLTSTSDNVVFCPAINLTVNAAGPIPVYTDKGKYKEFNKPIGIVLNDIAKTLLSFMGGLALLVLVICGIYFMMSRGNPETYGKAKRMLLYAILGLLAILLSYAMLVIIEGFAF